MLRNFLLRSRNILSNNKSNIRSIYCTNNVCLPRRIPGSTSNDKSTPSMSLDKYKIFDDKDAVIIENTSEELLADKLEEDEQFDEFEGINLERGVNGVFNIEDLVLVLRQENAKDIFVSAVPSNVQYADYVCIITGRSFKHNMAIAEFIHKLYKRKKHAYDIVPKIEGKDAKDWIAIDLGNIILHIFHEEVRKMYDLELLWSVGPQYDDHCKNYSDVSDVIQKNSMYLDDLFPDDEEEKK